MLRLLSSKAQEHKDFRKLSKPHHVGIHWKALADCSQMCQGFSHFQLVLHHFALAKLATSSKRFKLEARLLIDSGVTAVSWSSAFFSHQVALEVDSEDEYWQLLIRAWMLIHRIRNRQISLNTLATANSPKFVFCTCWCASFSVMQTIQNPSLVSFSLTSHWEKVRRPLG